MNAQSETGGLGNLSSKTDELKVARAENRALIEALRQVSEGVVICDADGNIVVESTPVFAWLQQLDGTALATQALGEVLAMARDGNQNIRSLELLGPPRYSLTLSGIPLFDESATPIGAVAVLENSTELKHHEGLLQDFVANVSHELKTPVGALGLLAEAISVEKSPEVVARLVDRMLVETERMGQVIDDLLNMSRIESLTSFVSEPLVVRHLIDETLARLRYTCEYRKITVQVHCPGEPVVYGNQSELMSALHHVLENAVKYSPDGSTIEIAGESDGLWTEISFTDHGMGIAGKYLDRIFERFYRVDDARKRTTGGTGLGLAIVRQVVQQHGGEVRVESREGEGSTFVLRLASTASIARDRLVIEGGTDG